MGVHSEKHNIEIVRRIENIQNYVSKTAESKADIVHFQRAIMDISKSYNGLIRSSGAPIILHSLRVAEMLTQISMAPKFVTAGLLHDLQEDTKISNREIKKAYGLWIAQVVEALTKDSCQSLTHEKLLSAGIKEPGILLIKLLDRLDNLKEIKFLPANKQKRIKKETHRFYFPLAEKFIASPVVKKRLIPLRYLV